MKTEYEFVLPHGYIDKNGTLHRRGVMRLATVLDEILPHNDPRIRKSPDFLKIILLGRVITSLGTLQDVTHKIIEDLLVVDLVFLEEMYNKINRKSSNGIKIVCPVCSSIFEIGSNSIPE